jgi:hypothetical protein
VIRELAPGSPLIQRLDEKTKILDGLPCLTVDP